MTGDGFRTAGLTSICQLLLSCGLGQHQKSCGQSLGQALPPSVIPNLSVRPYGEMTFESGARPRVDSDMNRFHRHQDKEGPLPTVGHVPMSVAHSMFELMLKLRTDMFQKEVIRDKGTLFLLKLVCQVRWFR